MSDDFRQQLADGLRGKYWSIYACQGDAYHPWDSQFIGDQTREVWLQMADRALMLFEGRK